VSTITVSSRTSQFKPTLGRPTPFATVYLHGEVVHLRPVTTNDAALLTEVLRLAVPTREYQPGGPPIHDAPTWSWPTSA
jgi:hypothetical protein